MTGEITQDLSQGYGLACLDMRRGCRDEEACRMLGIPRRFLPEIFPCHQVVGRLTKKAAEETGAILTVEDHSVINGLGAAVASVTAQNRPVPVRIIPVMRINTRNE